MKITFEMTGKEVAVSRKAVKIVNNVLEEATPDFKDSINWSKTEKAYTATVESNPFSGVKAELEFPERFTVDTMELIINAVLVFEPVVKATINFYKAFSAMFDGAAELLRPLIEVYEAKWGNVPQKEEAKIVIGPERIDDVCPKCNLKVMECSCELHPMIKTCTVCGIQVEVISPWDDTTKDYVCKNCAKQ